MGQRLLSKEQGAEIVSRYQAGETTRDLASAFGCSVQPIFRVLREAGVPTRKGGAKLGAASLNRRFTSEQDSEIAAEYEAGTSIRVIADKRSASPAAVHRALKRTGTARRDGHPNVLFTPEQDEQIAAEYVGGKGLATIALEHGCSAYPISAALKRQGIDRRCAGGRKREFTDDEINAMLSRYADGESQEALAAAFETSQNTVSRVIRSNGGQSRMWAKGPEAHGSWKGGRIDAAGGYIGVWMSPDDPFAEMRQNHGYVLEHRLVMARHLGRPLLPEETVHHGPGGTADNRIENLELWSGRHPKGQRVEDLLAFAHEIIALYQSAPVASGGLTVSLD